MSTRGDGRMRDVAIIGGGPGGYVAAIRASQLGARVSLIEVGKLGGICLNWGCIPTKALLRAAEIRRLATHADEFGFSFGDVTIDTKKLVARSRSVAGKLSRGVAFLMKKHGVAIVEDTATGLARTDDGAWRITCASGASLSARRVILAMGARARTLPDLGLVPDGEHIWTYREAMTPEVLPSSLLILGSGAIGMEFASFYADLGCDVTVVEAEDRILPNEDREISDMARKAFTAQGMTFHLSARVSGAEVKEGKVHLRLGSPEPPGVNGKAANGTAARELTADVLILAVGIVGNVENMGLEAIGLGIEGGHVQVDSRGRTGTEGLFAIGDLAGPPWLAHKASHEAVACVEAFLGQSEAGFDSSAIPACTYCHPQIASLGVTEDAARALGREVKVGRFPYGANGKALALGETEGVVKTIFDAVSGELLGAHILGPEATELIGVFALARRAELTEEDFIHTIFPHPTLSEALHESVLNACGRALHI